jgi:hypothetical protein
MVKNFIREGKAIRSNRERFLRGETCAFKGDNAQACGGKRRRKRKKSARNKRQASRGGTNRNKVE